MRLFRRRPKRVTEQEITEAHRWNRWADNQVMVWEALELLPPGTRREGLRNRARRMNDAMWQLDPPMWLAVSARWPDRYRDRRLS